MAISNFGKAFRAARESGDKEFTFNGKKYNTRMANETKAMPKASPMSSVDPAIAGQPMTKEESAKSMDRSGRLNSLENTDTEGMSTFKRGGKVGSASKRADGIAQRGKTRGTVVMCGGGRT
jgi:hypothetical protein